MHVLYLAHRIPFPLDKGEKIRAFHQIKALIRRGHHVHLLTFVDDPNDWQHVAALEAMCASVVALPLGPAVRYSGAARAMLAGRALSLGWFDSPAMHEAVSRALATRPIHVIVVFSSSMAQYVPADRLTHTVTDLVDADSEKFNDYARLARDPFRRWLFRREARCVRAHEQELAAACAACVVVSQREARFVQASGMTVISNGVDVEWFAGGPQVTGAAPRLVFVGSMDYRPNVDAVSEFVQHTWPIIRARRPDATFTIVGRAPTRRVRRLARRPGVTVTGRVRDVRPFLWAAAVCVVPLRVARGVQNKLLEALAAGCPVVSSAEAAAGIDAVAGQELVVADGPLAFADAVVRLLEDRRTSRRLAESGRTYVSRVHAWEMLAGRFVDTVQACGAQA